MPDRRTDARIRERKLLVFPPPLPRIRPGRTWKLISSSEDIADTALHHRFPHSAVGDDGRLPVSGKPPHCGLKIGSAEKRDANPMCR
ncbi:hypothetical protein B932_1759 [Gluconobacter oxydans H24]|nr:hypothetical protein B932_1759 [Gluconobacter oxydans H24]